VKRFNPSLASSLSTLAVLVVIGLILSFGAIGSSDTKTDDAGSVQAGGQQGGESTDAQATNAAKGEVPGSSAGQRTTTGQGGSQTGGSKSSECAAGKNGGSTDVGVTGGSIKLGSTAVLDGPGASFLASVRIAMNAVAKQVNAAGGICGRTLNLIIRNDSWKADLGKQFIRNFVEGEKVFALAVVPSSEGLNASDSYVREQKVPVVGTDGMLIKQYQNPWIWPVATPTISTMHVMAQDAFERANKEDQPPGPKDFGIVFDAHYHFGIEGAYAFNQAIKRLTGKDISGFDAANPKASLTKCTDRFCGIQPDQQSYDSDANRFNAACGLISSTDRRRRCDFVAVLLEPNTAVTWFQARREGYPQLYPTGAYGGAQPLFNRKFAETCKGNCNNMWVWTGYTPAINDLVARPGVAKYMHDVQAESPSLDVANQFVQGGYLGMQLLVHALEAVGPNVTRDNLRKQLDSMSLDLGLSKPLHWQAGNHFANTSAQAFSIQYKTEFSGWRQETASLSDPWVGQDSLDVDN
jgi:ABC-type branched-subunit amino acid transport system substrate-binding protein